MITPLFFMQLIGFQLWYISSKQVKHSNPPVYVLSVIEHPQRYRIIGGGLILLSTVLFVIKWGLMTGISSSVVGLMALGSLVIVLQPFPYLKEKAVFILCVLFLVLEILI